MRALPVRAALATVSPTAAHRSRLGATQGGERVKPTVFIHTNHRQRIGALVSAYSLRRNSAAPETFDVRLIEHADHDFFQAREGQPYLRDGHSRVWRNDDLQSFTPLRFMPPELMGYEGRAVVMDPDIFAVGDVAELLDRDMEGKAILCRPRGGAKQLIGALASSVMLLDCAKLRHWKTAEQFDEMFEWKRDYGQWIGLHLEDRGTIGLFENEWNDFDRLTPRTKLLHNTKRKTQPWKTGLPVDFVPAEGRKWSPLGMAKRARRRLLGDYALLGEYVPHPDPRQEEFFFGLLRECIDRGEIAEALVREEMARNHVRHDAFEVLERAPVPAAPAAPTGTAGAAA